MASSSSDIMHSDEASEVLCNLERSYSLVGKTLMAELEEPVTPPKLPEPTDIIDTNIYIGPGLVPTGCYRPSTLGSISPVTPPSSPPRTQQDSSNPYHPPDVACVPLPGGGYYTHIPETQPSPEKKPRFTGNIQDNPEVACVPLPPDPMEVVDDNQPDHVEHGNALEHEWELPAIQADWGESQSYMNRAFEVMFNGLELPQRIQVCSAYAKFCRAIMKAT